jgi:hypothetical protein
LNEVVAITRSRQLVGIKTSIEIVSKSNDCRTCKEGKDRRQDVEIYRTGVQTLPQRRREALLERAKMLYAEVCV